MLRLLNLKIHTLTFLLKRLKLFLECPQNILSSFRMLSECVQNALRRLSDCSVHKVKVTFTLCLLVYGYMDIVTS